MKVIEFKSETTPWCVVLPARFSNDGKRKTRYFKTKEFAERFARNVCEYGMAAAVGSDEVYLELAIKFLMANTSLDRPRAIVALLQKLAASLGETNGGYQK